MLRETLTKDKAEAADLLRCVRASAYQLADESSLQRAREEREARSSQTMVKIEVTGDERLTRTFLEGLTAWNRRSPQPQQRVACEFPAKTLLSNLPLRQEKARVTLQLVVNTGNTPIMKVASLEDRFVRMLVGLEGDCVKMDAMRTPH